MGATLGYKKSCSSNLTELEAYQVSPQLPGPVFGDNKTETVMAYMKLHKN